MVSVAAVVTHDVCLQHDFHSCGLLLIVMPKMGDFHQFDQHEHQHMVGRFPYVAPLILLCMSAVLRSTGYSSNYNRLKRFLLL